MNIERLRPFIWPAAFCLAAMALCATILLIAGKTADTAVSLLRGDVSSSFASYTLGVSGKAQLALCSAKRMETLKMTVPNKISYSEITAIMPAEFTYYVDMKGKWSLVASDGVLKVVAPPLELLTPAPDLAGTMVVIDKSIFDFGRAQEKVDGLKAQAAARLRARGMTQEALKEVRETARLELASFVATWLEAGRKGKVESILVRFADEPGFPPIGFAKPKM